MWLQGKALSSHALPPDRSIAKIAIRPGGKLRKSPVTGYWTVVQHRAISLGGPCGACAYGFYCGVIGRLFPPGGKIPVDFANKSPTGEAGYALKSVVRLQAGNLEPCGHITPFVNLFCIVTF